jgi:hypothetical protein
MPIFKLKISGISMLYSKDRKSWKVIFPFVSRRGNGSTCHKVSIKINGSATGINLVDKITFGDEVTIRIVASGGQPNFDGTQFGEFLNITDNSHLDAHRYSDLKLIDPTGPNSWRKRSMLLEVPSGSLSAIKSQFNYFIHKNGSNGHALGKIGREGIITLNAATLRIEVVKKKGLGEVDVIAPLQYSANTEIHFDNDCNNISELSGGDFQYIYSVFDADDTLNIRSDRPLVPDESLPCHLVGIDPLPPNLP